jgi:hypothetical protein
MIFPMLLLCPDYLDRPLGERDIWWRSFAWIFGEAYNRRDVGQRSLDRSLNLAVQHRPQHGVDILNGFRRARKEVVNGDGECHAGVEIAKTQKADSRSWKIAGISTSHSRCSSHVSLFHR